MKDKVFSKIDELFGIDLRALAIFRICLGVILIFELLNYMVDLKVFFGDEGFLPRFLVMQEFPNIWNFSIHMVSGRVEVQAVLFILALIATFCFLVGYHTRLVTFYLWFFILSAQVRNYLVFNIYDYFEHLLLFWCNFLPLGACYSVDSALDPQSNKLPKRVLSFGTAGTLCQIAFMLFFAGALKTTSDPWKQGTAIYYSLNLSEYITGLGDPLLQYPELLKYLTYGALLVEIGSPFLLFSPFFTKYIRVIGIVLASSLFLGIEIFLRVGPVPILSNASFLLFVPGWVWEKIIEFLKPPSSETLKIYYETEDNFKRSILLIFKTFFLGRDATVSPQNKLGAEDHWLLVEYNNDKYTNDDAIRVICTSSWLLTYLAKLFSQAVIARVVSFLLNKTLANEFFKKKAHMFLKEGGHVSVRLGLVSSFLAAFFLVYIFISNVSVLTPKVQIPKSLLWVGSMLWIDQKFAMFIPPGEYSGWMIIAGKLKDGAEVDLLTGGRQLTFERPKDIPALFKNHRWQRYLIALQANFTHAPATAPYYVYYLCNKWNSKHKGPKELVNLDFYYMLQKTILHGSKDAVQKIVLFSLPCSQQFSEAPLTIGSILERFRDLRSDSRYSSFLEYLEQAVREGEPDNLTVGEYLYRFAITLKVNGKLEEAESILNYVLQLWRTIFDPDHFKNKEVLYTLLDIYEKLGKEDKIQEVKKQLEE